MVLLNWKLNMPNRKIVVLTSWFCPTRTERIRHFVQLQCDVSNSAPTLPTLDVNWIKNKISYLLANTAEPMKPAFVKPIKDLKVTIGQPLLLEAQIVGFPSPEIKWFKDGAQLRPSKALNFVNQPGGLIGLKYV